MPWGVNCPALAKNARTGHPLVLAVNLRGKPGPLADYRLLAPAAMAERLRKVAALFPPNPAFEFAVYYKRCG